LGQRVQPSLLAQVWVGPESRRSQVERLRLMRIELFEGQVWCG
jgi:hypothetical protein